VQPRVVMTIAGSDSGGGAGIQADLRTFAARGVHGTSAITAVTAQNTTSVTAVCALEAEMVRAQIDAVTSDFSVAAVKTGMLARPRTIEAVARAAADGLLPNMVVDPVLVSSSGHALMEAGGLEMYQQTLLPFAAVVTPNLREACLLAGVNLEDVTTIDSMIELGQLILQRGCRFVVVKGGHFASGTSRELDAPDVIVSENFVEVLHATRVTTRNDHGTGCSLSAAIAAQLALGDQPVLAITTAKDFVRRALESAAHWDLGAGHGPINHLGWM
jgi:hydroxymethylpyrimidine/phosphomethylpyrimidine kinase